MDKIKRDLQDVELLLKNINRELEGIIEKQKRIQSLPCSGFTPVINIRANYSNGNDPSPKDVANQLAKILCKQKTKGCV